MKLALITSVLLGAAVFAGAEDMEHFRWRGRVDGVDDILIQGNQVRIEHVSAKPIQNQEHRFTAPLPFAEVELELEILEGRGSVRLMEQPSQRNQFTAVVRIDDQDQGGDSKYEFELSWSRKETIDKDGYSSVFRWRGRVDIGCDIEVRGSHHEVKDQGGAGTHEKSVSFSAPLPASDTPVSVDKLDGRGSVELVQTPSSANNFTAVVRIEDPKGGADEYNFELRWPRE
ncbi:MAG TPA: hypothetical protein VLK65_12090 [Vicinamibacteria bacterium]|nr:hypothetical protein [Vicinamibacteria bacterium]